MQPTQQIPKPKHFIISPWAMITLIFFALCGFADATYLTIDHFKNIVPPCFVGSCQIVLTSAYSTFLGIPVAIFGVVYYLFIVVALIISIDIKNPQKKATALRIALFATPFGFLASLYFFCIQAFVLHDFCQYCLFSATTSTILFIIALCLWRVKKTNIS